MARTVVLSYNERTSNTPGALLSNYSDVVGEQLPHQSRYRLRSARIAIFVAVNYGTVAETCGE